jgi:hypothetical protein
MTMTRHDLTRSSGSERVTASEGVKARDVTNDLGVSEAKRRFGGIDVPATLAGTLAALGAAVLIGGVLAAAGNFGYQQGISGEAVSIAGLLAGLVTLLIAFLIGGWVAGRIARYDGGLNGLMTALWFVVLAAIAGAAGAWAGNEYDVFADVQLPQWFSEEATSWQAIASGLVALVVMFVAGFVGGKLGERYHRRADALIVHTRGQGLLATRTDRPDGTDLGDGDATDDRTDEDLADEDPELADRDPEVIEGHGSSDIQASRGRTTTGSGQ